MNKLRSCLEKSGAKGVLLLYRSQLKKSIRFEVSAQVMAQQIRVGMRSECRTGASTRIS
jgi:hypothetical protein